MKAIKASNTAPERYVRRLLLNIGVKYRTNYRGLPGTPDIKLVGRKKVILVHGCFWHYHQCHLFKLPQSNRQKWSSKLIKSVIRDREVYSKIEILGYQILVVWECALRGKRKLKSAEVEARIEEWIFQHHKSIAISSHGFESLPLKHQ